MFSYVSPEQLLQWLINRVNDRLPLDATHTVRSVVGN